MIKIPLLILTCFFILSCGTNESSESGTNNSSGKYGDWEQDDQGTKYREDYELRDMLNGNEVVKYTRINGGQFGGGSSTTKFIFCSDGSMRYQHESLTTVSVDGAGGSDASKVDDEGTWQAIENEKGLKLIILRSTKYNTTGYMEVNPLGSKINMVWFNEWQEFFVKKIDC